MTLWILRSGILNIIQIAQRYLYTTKEELEELLNQKVKETFLGYEVNNVVIRQDVDVTYLMFYKEYYDNALKLERLLKNFYKLIGIKRYVLLFQRG